MILHILDNFLPQHTAGIEVYVYRLCVKSPESNFVLITGERSYKYEYQGIEVNVIKICPEFEIEFSNLLEEKKINCAHYHQFNQGPFYDSKTLKFLKRKNIRLKFTFHLVQYYCTTLRLKQNNLNQCTIKANHKACTRCYFESIYKDKAPFFLRNYYLLQIFKGFSKVQNALNSSQEIVSKNLERFGFILNIFDELETINEDFYLLLNNFHEIRNKLTFLPQVEFQISLKLPVKSDELKLIYLGRVEKSKGIEKLIRLAIKLNNSSITIDIYGQINDTIYNEKYFFFASKKTKTKLNYRGILLPENVLNTISQYDYLIHPSEIAEMTPLVIQEAFKVNVPVIGNDIFGINSYVQNGVNGWLFDFNNLKSASELFNVLVDDK
jgi:glycosyltransferase involved in cell wall biosynthesis